MHTYFKTPKGLISVDFEKIAMALFSLRNSILDFITILAQLICLLGKVLINGKKNAWKRGGKGEEKGRKMLRNTGLELDPLAISLLP